MSEETNEPMSEEEQFATLYYYFVMHLRGLAAQASEQLSSGYFDVPWEVKDDLTREAALLHLASASTLSHAEKDGIAALIAELNRIPASGSLAAGRPPPRKPCATPAGKHFAFRLRNSSDC